MCILLIFNVNTTFGDGDGKIKIGSRTMGGSHICLHSIKLLFFVISENISTKANGRRLDIYHVNVFVICWNYLKFSCNLMFFENKKVQENGTKTSASFVYILWNPYFFHFQEYFNKSKW